MADGLRARGPRRGRWWLAVALAGLAGVLVGQLYPTWVLAPLAAIALVVVIVNVVSVTRELRRLEQWMDDAEDS